MNAPGVLKAVTILTGLVVAGEALALLIGMHLLSKGDNPPLFVLNNVKILGLLAVLALALARHLLGSQGLP